MKSRHRSRFKSCAAMWMALATALAVTVFSGDARAQSPTPQRDDTSVDAGRDLGGDDSTVSFRAQNLPLPDFGDPNSQAARIVLREFLKDHPNYVIEPFVMPQTQGVSMDTGPLMAIAADIPPHAIYVNFRQSSTYISQGFLAPLETLLARLISDDPLTRQTDARDEWLADPSEAEVERAMAMIRERVRDRVWPVVYRDGHNREHPGEHVWALPTGTVTQALLYRKDLFAEAGLDPERPPETWDELLDAAQKLTVPERRQYGLYIIGGQTLSYGVYTFLVSNGARAVEQNEQGEWYAAYDTQETAEAVEYVWRLANESFERDGQTIRGAAIIDAGGAEGMAWSLGRIGMKFDYLNDTVLSGINPQLIGIAPVPVSHRGTRGSEINSQMMGVFSGSTKAQQLAVMRYLWFITGDEAKRIKTKILVDNGYGVFVNPVLLETFGYDRILKQVPEGWRQVVETTFNAGVPEPYGKNTQNIYQYMTRPIEQALELDLDQMPHDEAIEQIHALLRASVEETNTKLLGQIPPEEMRKRRIVAVIVLVFVGISFVWGFIAIWRYFGRNAPVSTEGGGSRRTTIVGYLLLLPILAMTVLWAYVPLGWGFGLAFTDYRLVIDSTFVGIDNFANVLFDETFWYSFGRTFLFVGLVIGLGFWPPILLAILLDEVPTETLKYLFRTIYYLPAIISGIIVMFLWKQMYDPSRYGVLNQLLLSVNELGPIFATLLKLVLLGLWLSLIWTLLWLPMKLDEMGSFMKAALWLIALAFIGITIYPLANGTLSVSDIVGRFELEPLGWTRSPETAMLCTVLPLVWAGSGPGCLLYLAALKTVPSDMYEAADIDGAGTWHKVCYITLPRLKYLIIIQFIAAVVGAFKGGTDYILALTGGGPNDATMILALQIFVRTFMELEFGIGSAMAWLLGALLVGFTAYQLKMLSNAEFKAAGSSDTEGG